METSIRTRMGDGSLIETTRSELRAEIEEGTEQAARRARVAPLIEEEIAYRLLMGEQGPQLRQIASSGSQSFQIARAIDWLKKNYERPMKVEELADLCKMSTSSFHRHFRMLTAMSPLQYQKVLRLQEARRLMLTERLDAASTAYRVGYESPSQFSREYNRMFKASPSRDIRALLKHDSGERLYPA